MTPEAVYSSIYVKLYFDAEPAVTGETMELGNDDDVAEDAEATVDAIAEGLRALEASPREARGG